MNKDKERNLSKFMTKILRHAPYDFGILPDEKGFVEANDLLIAITGQTFWKETTVEDFKTVARNCKKQRFELDGTKIRARYGHSFKRISYEEGTPPEVLLHGTAKQNLGKIFAEGLKKMDREYVHLSESDNFASLAGSRHGELVLLEIDTEKAMEEEIKFYYAGNEVWLADYIPPKFLSVKQ
jgi:putative RNA 2'-phosphotransferase